jgi:hypothetical protein
MAVRRDYSERITADVDAKLQDVPSSMTGEWKGRADRKHQDQVL